jgi:hypothetical protein
MYELHFQHFVMFLETQKTRLMKKHEKSAWFEKSTFDHNKR